MMGEALDHGHASETNERPVSRAKVWRRVVTVAVAAFLVLGIAAARHGDWHGPPRSQVVGVWLQPLEGPGGYPLTSPAAAPWAIFNPAQPLPRILPNIPDPLPPPLRNGSAPRRADTSSCSSRVGERSCTVRAVALTP